MDQMMNLPDLDEREALLTIRDRNGRDLCRAACERAKQLGVLAQELADLNHLAPGEGWALLSADGTERYDPTVTVDEVLGEDREASLVLASDLVGN